MALIRVREKHPAEGAAPLITYVDEGWLERWPDDFDIEPEPAPETAPEAPQEPAAGAGSASADAPATEAPARGRF